MLHSQEKLTPEQKQMARRRRILQGRAAQGICILAAFAAITLYAVHQQSRRETSLHRDGYSFGRSARLLAKHSNTREAVRARFAAVGTATSWDETLHHARGLVQQFRQYSIPLDYGQFARDLFDLQQPTTADRVRLRWGRDFFRARHVEDDDTTPDGTETALSDDND